MTELNKMYDGVVNSPETYLTQNLAQDGTVLYVADGSIFETLPNLAVIGSDQTAETILVKSRRSDGGFDIDRGIENVQRNWEKITSVARNFTNYDYKQLKDNIEILNKNKLEESSNIAFTTASSKTNILSTDSIKVIFGKLSKWFSDLENISWTGKLADGIEDSRHRLVTDAEKEKWNNPPSPNLTDYLKTSHIINNLSSGGKNKVLSAEQGKILDSSKVDKQYFFDILMGESLVTRKAGEWPVVHGKPDSIGDSTFSSNQLISVVIPPSVTSIGNSAFNNNQLTSVIIPPNVTSIGDYAFNNNQLISVVIPPSVTSIGKHAFNSNQLTSVIIPPNVTSIGDYAFNNNQLISVVIPPNVTSIGKHAFNSNQLTSVIIPPNVTSIGNSAFSNNQLTSVVIPPSVTSIGKHAFNSNQLTSVIISNSVTSIGDYAFYHNKLMEVKVSKNCTLGTAPFDPGVNIIRY